MQAKQVWITIATIIALAGGTFLSYRLGVLQYTNTVIALAIGGVWIYALLKRNAALCLGIGIFYSLCTLNDKAASVAFRPFVGYGFIAELMIFPVMYLLSVLPLICWMFFSIKGRYTPLKDKVRAKDIGIMLGTMVLLGVMTFFVYKTAVMYDGMSWFNMEKGKLYPSGMEMQMTGVACVVIVFVLCLLACIKRIDFILLGVSLYYMITCMVHFYPVLLVAGTPPVILAYPYIYLLYGRLDQADMRLGFFYLLSAVPLLIFAFNRVSDCLKNRQDDIFTRIQKYGTMM